MRAPLAWVKKDPVPFVVCVDMTLFLDYQRGKLKYKIFKYLNILDAHITPQIYRLI